MTDRNGIEIKTGDIVEITGAYFKNDNGLYYVERSPGDPSWTGRDYSLHRISRRGKISTAKYNLCFWPISVFVSDRFKAAAAREWNKDHAQIEVKGVSDLTELIAHFEAEAEAIGKQKQQTEWRFGEGHPEVGYLQTIQVHHLAVAKRLRDAKKSVSTTSSSGRSPEKSWRRSSSPTTTRRPRRSSGRFAGRS